MKLTKDKLRRIIKEELESVLDDQGSEMILPKRQPLDINKLIKSIQDCVEATRDFEVIIECVPHGLRLIAALEEQNYSEALKAARELYNCVPAGCKKAAKDIIKQIPRTP